MDVADVWAHLSVAPGVIDTYYRGVRAVRAPWDLMTLAAVIYETKPDYIVECGAAHGGTSLFLADQLQTAGGKAVHSIDIQWAGKPTHPLLTCHVGNTLEVFPDLPGRTMVILDSDHTYDHVAAELAVWGPRVGPGCYLVVDDVNVTYTQGWDRGPGEAAADWLASQTRFVDDPSRSFGGLTCALWLQKT